jgi:glycosyltransferase involved in cell wall biosynthesis
MSASAVSNLSSVMNHQDPHLWQHLNIAVIIPCLNEEATIAQVVTEVRKALPRATVYVYDNGSQDQTVEVAQRAGAQVRIEPKRGKGRALRSAFRDIEAQLYIMVDGDATYDVSVLPQMLDALMDEKLDMVVGNRLSSRSAHNRQGHYLGNKLFSGLISRLFEFEVKDPFSGLRVMTARFVKSFPSVSKGFEVETELTVHAYDFDAAFKEMNVTYRERPEDSHSKLRTF